jgi:hypothetical protein
VRTNSLAGSKVPGIMIKALIGFEHHAVTDENDTGLLDFS